MKRTCFLLAVAAALACWTAAADAAAGKGGGKKGGGGKPPPAKKTPATPPAPSPDPPTDSETPPPANEPASSSGGHGPADGFGKGATGGSGAPRSVPANAGALAGALKQGGAIQVQKGDIDAAYNQIVVKDNTTLDGGGATLWFPGTNHNGTGLSVFGKNIVLRNIRVRNSGDGIALGSASFKGTRNVLVENVSATGNGDDGFSCAYGASDITLRWSMLAGNARCIFHKYGGGNLTVHHSILTHAWIRMPLSNSAVAHVDFRNNLVQHWSMTASNCESGAKGNFVNNVYRFEAWAGGKKDCAIQAVSGGEVYASGNKFEGCSARSTNFKSSPVFEAPPIPTDPTEAVLQKVLDETNGAGCMPRDQVDKNYLTSKEKCPSGDPAHGLQVEGSKLGK